jgi:polyferredoxin
MARRSHRRHGLHRFRRLFQVFFLLVFFALLTLTFWPLGTLLMSAFLLADPLMSLNSVANGVVRWEFLLAVPVLLSALFIGRAFCGYACPLGFMIELFGPRRERHPGPRARKVLRKVPLIGLVIILALIIFGSAVFLVFDPISLFTRSASTLVYPTVDRTLRLAGDLFYLAPPLRGGVDSVTEVLTGRLVFDNGLVYRLQLVILLMFVGVLAISWIERRMWCRHLCPLGALLGLVGRAAIFGRVMDEDACTDCGACTDACPMDAVRDSGHATDCSRCEGGLECADACPQNAIRWGLRPRKQRAYDPSRRTFLKAGGLAVVGGFFLYTGLGRIQRNTYLVRPPGARSELDFLSTCSRCAQCMKSCPTNVIQPAIFDAGLEGFMTPQMDFRRGYCDWSCNECGKVCPTQAIRHLPLEQKRLKVIGRAYIDRNTCIPWAEGDECLVCQELCPIPDKAIVFNTGQVLSALPESEGEQQTPVRLPIVVADRCIGCGICEYNCPVNNGAAIRVRSMTQTESLSR